MAGKDDKIPAHCDVAVVGAGVGGLTAAAMLAQSGLDVLVFEAQDRPGGYLTCFERRGFRFDSSLHWLNQFRPGGFAYRLLGIIGDDFPRCKPMNRIFRCVSDSFDYSITTNPQTFADYLKTRFPHEESGINRFFSDCEKLGHRLKTLDDRIQSCESMSHLEALDLGATMTWRTLPMWKIVKASPEKGLSRYFKDPAIKRLFARESTFVSMMMPIAWAYSGEYQLPPEGGSETLVKWIASRAEGAGARIFTRARVKSVRLDTRKRATGIAMEDGREVTASHVIAACDQQSLYESILPSGAIPQRILKAVRNADIYYSSFTVFIGLDVKAESLGFRDDMLYVLREDVTREEQSGGDPLKTAVSVIAPSVRDPTLAPPGKGTLMINCPAYLSSYDRWKTGPGLQRGEAYRLLKQQVADILIDRVEKGLKISLCPHIEVMETASPATYWRYTGNKDGSAMGTSPTRKNILARIARIRTPVRNLFLGGHWAEYGGGVPLAMKAGANAALVVLNDRKHPRAVQLKKAMRGHSVQPLTVGIPRALGYFLYPDLWETFFRELGMKPLVSSPTARPAVQTAGLISETEHCLPVKIFDAHLAELAGKADLLFVPRILSCLPEHIACPKLGALPDAARAQFGDRVPILTVDVNEKDCPLAETLLQLGRMLNAEDSTTQSATRSALAALRDAHRRSAAARPGGPLRFLVVAHPYNLHDEYVSGPILKKLQSLNVSVDVVPYGLIPVPDGPLKWDTASVMHDTIRRLRAKACAGVIHLSSFNCGCDSIVGEVLKGMLKERGIPGMTMVLDEHLGQAGVDTRLEAFVDSITWGAPT